MRQERDYIRKSGLPVALEVTDEPRENPNPWNRNLADSITYADLMREAGVTSFITPMGDKGDGKDYTVLADHVDISGNARLEGIGRLDRADAREGQDALAVQHRHGPLFLGLLQLAGAVGRPLGVAFLLAGRRGRMAAIPAASGTIRSPDVHGFAPYAPPADYPGGMLFQSKFLDVSEGITDYAYLITLNKAIRGCRARRQACRRP